MKFILWSFLFTISTAMGRAYAIESICENYVSSYISGWAISKDRISKKAQHQELVDDLAKFQNDNIHREIAEEIKSTLLIALDKVYSKNFPTATSQNFLAQVSSLEEQTQADCVKRLTALKNHQKQRERNNTGSVIVKAECNNLGYCGAKTSIESAGYKSGTYVNNNGSVGHISGNNIAGRYRYHVSFDDNKAQYCTGSFDVYAGNKEITLYINKNNCNLNNIHRYP